MTETTPPYEVDITPEEAVFPTDPLFEAVEMFRALREMDKVEGVTFTIEAEDFTLRLASINQIPKSDLLAGLAERSSKSRG